MNIFTQDNVPSHATDLTIAHLAKKYLKCKDNKLMEYLAGSSEINSSENLRCIYKKYIYKNGENIQAKNIPGK